MKKQKRPENLRKNTEISKGFAWVPLKHGLVLQNKTLILERKLSRKSLVQNVNEKSFCEVVVGLHEYSSQEPK